MPLANELTYDIKPTKGVHYKYQYVPTELGTGTINALQPAGGDVTRFNLPVSVFNLSRSYIEFTLTPTQSQTATPTALANWFHLDGFMFWHTIRLITRSGVILYDNTALAPYLNATSRRNQKIEDVATWGKPKRNGSTANNAAVAFTGNFNGLTCVNETANTGSSSRADGSTLSTPYLEPAYMTSGALYSTSTVGTPVLNVKLQLDFIKDSIFAVDKDLYFGGEIVTIEIVWAPFSFYIFQSTSIFTPSTGVQAYPTTGAASVIAVTGLGLKLAIEDDAQNAAEVQNQVMKNGLKIIAPWFTFNQVNIVTSQTQSVSMILNPSMGTKLKRVYWVPYSAPTASNQYRWFHSNCDTTGISGWRTSSYFTTLDEQQLQYSNINCANDDCYMRMKELMRGSCILSDNEHFFNWVHIDDFTVGTAPYARPEHIDGVFEDSFWQGYDLVKDVRYGVTAQFTTNTDTSTGNDYTTENHYIFAITLKVLNITTSSISIA